MKDRPILFSAPMVRAILEGRKTQTRRVVKNAHVITCDDRFGATDARCPYGVPGDRLWVKEKWRPAWHPEMFCSVQYASDSSYRKPTINDETRGHRFADMCEQSGDNAEPWHPSIHMWREFSRLTLEVVAVRVERLQVIGLADCAAEGAPPTHPADNVWDSTETYRKLWESINGVGSWDANPWVWVIEFKRIEARP